MKKYGILITVLVLTAVLLTGCRGSNNAPTELPPTTGATLPTTMPTTMPTTAPTVAPTTEAPMDATANTETGAAGGGMTDGTDSARSNSGAPMN